MSLWKKNALYAISRLINASAALSEGMFASWTWGSHTVPYAGQSLKRIKSKPYSRKTAGDSSTNDVAANFSLRCICAGYHLSDPPGRQACGYLR